MKRNFSALDNNIYNYNYLHRRNENKSFYLENTTDNIDNFLGRSFIQRQNVKKKKWTCNSISKEGRKERRN